MSNGRSVVASYLTPPLIGPTYSSAVRSGADSVLFRKHRFSVDCLFFINMDGPRLGPIVLFILAASGLLRAAPTPPVAVNRPCPDCNRDGLQTRTRPPTTLLSKVSPSPARRYVTTLGDSFVYTRVYTVNTLPRTSGPVETVVGATRATAPVATAETRAREPPYKWPEVGVSPTQAYRRLRRGQGHAGGTCTPYDMQTHTRVRA